MMKMKRENKRYKCEVIIKAFSYNKIWITNTTVDDKNEHR